ncbi:DUF317 domain-containing protein [Streptomyces nigrescens]
MSALSSSGDASAPHPVYAAPRHLAGGGDPRHVTAPLIARGWITTSVPGALDLRLISPDRQAELALTPDPDKPWWTIHTPVLNTPSVQPGWHASFGARTPVEALAGLTEALTNTPPTTVPDPWARMAEAGWQVTEGRHVKATSPDETAQVQLYRDGAYQHWRIAVEHDFVGTPHEVWSAHFSGSTPTHLVAGFTAALVDPRPVLRAPDALPVLSRDRVHTAASDERPGQADDRLQRRIAAARFVTSRAAPRGTASPTLPPSAASGPGPGPGPATGAHRR